MIVSDREVSVPQPWDAVAFQAWLAPHWEVMLRLAMRLAGQGEAEDVVQDAVSAAWRKRSQFDPDRGTPRSWLLAIVADQAGKSRRRRADTIELADLPVTDRAPDMDLRRAVSGLPGRQRVAVECFYYLGLPIAEVAAVMGCAEGTVKATLAAARAHLRRELEDQS